jgi:hypothetical protein
VLVILFTDGLAQGWMIARTEHSKVLKTSGGVLRTSARVLIYIIGGLMALSSIGFDVTPVLATLGIGSAAAGFALKGTLEDFLAGLLIAADQPLAVGDFIIVSDEHQGWVLAIGWRTTRILTRYDMHVIVPNSKLAQSSFINTSRPREECRFHAIAMISFPRGPGRGGATRDRGWRVRSGERPAGHPDLPRVRLRRGLPARLRRAPLLAVLEVVGRPTTACATRICGASRSSCARPASSSRRRPMSSRRAPARRSALSLVGDGGGAAHRRIVPVNRALER